MSADAVSQRLTQQYVQVCTALGYSTIALGVLLIQKVEALWQALVQAIKKPLLQVSIFLVQLENFHLISVGGAEGFLFI